MGLFNLDAIFKPKAIAVIGASETPGTSGKILMRNLIQGGYTGELLPVSPEYSTLFNMPVYPSITEVDREVDLAIIATPIDTVPEIIASCAERNIGGAIVVSAGAKETGQIGSDIDERIRSIAYAGKVRIMGPSCLGIILPRMGLNASFAAGMPDPGNLAFVSQSGSICTSILDLAFRENIGFSHFISMGAMLDVDFGDMIDYLGNDPYVKSILLYIESLANYRKFMSATRSVSTVKPIVVLKAGRSQAGAEAVLSHTGSMASEDVVYDAAFKRAGIVRVNTIQELFDCAELMAKEPRPAGSNLAIVTNGGGPGIMAVDMLAHYGIESARLEDDTLNRLDACLPQSWSRANPIDILGDASPERFSQVTDICMQAKEFDGMLVILAPQALTDPVAVAAVLIETFTDKKYPLFASWMGGRRVSEAVAILNQAGIPTYETPERAVRAFLFMVEYNKNLEMMHELPPKVMHGLKLDKETAVRAIHTALEKRVECLTETDSKEVLTSYGIPVNRTQTATTEDDAVRIAEEIGFPVAMKLLSPDITHKTDANGVHLDLRSEPDIRHAFQAIMAGAEAYRPGAHITGATVQAHIVQPDYELLIGAKKDKNFGPIILFGMGGIFTEVLQDRALGLTPLNHQLAHRLMESTRAYTLLKGYRKRPPADMEKLEDIITRLSQLLIDFPEIAELDMNPVLIKDGAPLAVDGRIVLKPVNVTSPMHLVISPYPQQYEGRETTYDGRTIFIRPVKPEDASLLIELFNVLSPSSIFNRFLVQLKAMTSDMLMRFTQIDYDREIALVAEMEHNVAGVARIIGDPDGKIGEFSILIGDPWQGNGIGGKLLSKCLQIAKESGMERIWGIVHPENHRLISLVRKLGFSVRFKIDENECEVIVDTEDLML